MIGVQTDIFSILGEQVESRKEMLFRLNLQRGSGFEGGKKRILEAVRKHSGQFPELCKLIRDEYGTGGHSGAEHSFVTYDSRGIRIEDKTQISDSPETSEWLYTWPEVTRKIIELVVMDEY